MLRVPRCVAAAFHLEPYYNSGNTELRFYSAAPYLVAEQRDTPMHPRHCQTFLQRATLRLPVVIVLGGVGFLGLLLNAFF